MKKYTIGFIGYGNMAQAICTAFVSDITKSKLKRYGYKIKVAVSDPDEEKLNFAPYGVAVTTNNKALVSACDVIFCAIKPQVAKEVLSSLDFTGKIVVSIMASVSLDVLIDLTGNTANKIVRVMPNLNAKIGSAYSTFCYKGLSADEKIFVELLLSSFGEVQSLDESLMNVSTGICGSGPAFVFKFIKAYYENGIKNGLDKKVALNMALSTIIGSAYLVESQGEDVDIDSLIKSVCSKGGTTIQGVNHLDEKEFENTVSCAIDKAIARAEEMSKQNENC